MIRRMPFVLWLAICLSLPAADFHLSPVGDDANDGSADKPFGTLARARDAVREHRRTHGGDVTVWLHGGTYRIRETVLFSLADSAPEGCTTTYAAVPGEHPVITSALPLRNWQRLTQPPEGLPAASRAHVWVADVTDIQQLKAGRADLPSGAGLRPSPQDRTRFFTLLNAGRPLPRAAGPGFRPTNSTPVRHGKDRGFFHFPAGAVRPWERLADAELRIVPCSFWAMNLLRFASVDQERRIATMATEGTYALGRNGMNDRPSCWVENVVEVLNEPGEWVLDSDAARVYLWPPSGPPGPELAVPVLTELVRVEGNIDYDGPRDTPVRGLVFDGLAFTGGDRLPWSGNTGWGLQHDWEMFDRPSALLRFRGAEDCIVRNCEFSNTAHSAVRLDLHCQRNRLVGNHIHDVGGVAILLAGYGPGTKDVNTDNEILNSYIHHTGRQYWGCPAVFLWQSGRNRVAHNHIHHTSYTAIVVSGRISWVRDSTAECAKTCRFEELEAVLGENFKRPAWQTREQFLHARHNVVEYNEMHNVMERCGDGNAVYVSGCGTGNTIRRNWCHDNFGKYMNAVIRNDDDQHGSVFDGNIVARSRGHGEGFINKGANTITNNIVADLRPTNRHRGHLVLVRYPQNGAVHAGNVYYSRRSGQVPVSEGAGHKSNQKGSRLRDMASDRNIYFSEADPDWAKELLADARTHGVELKSLGVDPKFVDVDRDDYRFEPDSPALKLGIPQPIDVVDCGLQEPYRSRFIGGARIATTISPEGGRIEGGDAVTISASEPEAAIRYTTDGREPTADSRLYTAPIKLAEACTIRARAFHPGAIDLVGAEEQFSLPPGPVEDDFETTAVGSEPADAEVTVESEECAVTVSEETAATGKRSLAFVDGPGQRQPFNPHMRYRTDYRTGIYSSTFSVRLSPTSDFYVQWRDYTSVKPFCRGPSFHVIKGVLVEGEDALATLPCDAWLHVELRCKLGEQSPEYDMIIRVPNRAEPLRFSGLKTEPGFTRMEWLGFVSAGQNRATTFLDDVRLSRTDR